MIPQNAPEAGYAPLTATEVKQAKPQEKPRKLSDGGGLYLLVTPSGAKYWRYKYRFGGKEKVLSLGGYPEEGLKARFFAGFFISVM